MKVGKPTNCELYVETLHVGVTGSSIVNTSLRYWPVLVLTSGKCICNEQISPNFFRFFVVVVVVVDSFVSFC